MKRPELPEGFEERLLKASRLLDGIPDGLLSGTTSQDALCIVRYIIDDLVRDLERLRLCGDGQ